jgi:hypothetical protein
MHTDLYMMHMFVPMANCKKDSQGRAAEGKWREANVEPRAEHKGNLTMAARGPGTAG